MVTKINTSSSPKTHVPRKANTPGRPTLQELEKRKVAILDIATSLFLQQGYASTSLVDIAKQAGVATRTIYQHYGDKEDIFRAVVDRRIEEKQKELPVIDINEDLVSVLFSITKYINAVSLSDKAIPFQRLLTAESNRFPELMGKVFQEQYERFHLTVTAIFERLEETGKIPPGDHSRTARYFNDLMHGVSPLDLILSWSLSEPGDDEIREKVSLFIVGRFGLKADSDTGK